MSYIDRINAFWNWRMFNQLPDKAVALYFALLHCANRAGFPDEVCVPNSTLLSLTQMSERDLYRTRNILTQQGLVTVDKGRKGQAACYRLNIISDKYGGNPVSNLVGNPVSNVVGNPVGNPVNIYRIRLDKDKKRNSPPKSPKGGLKGERKAALFDAFWEQYPRKVGKGDARKSWDKLELTEDLSDRIFHALQKQKTWEQWQRDGGRFIPHPATWLNQQRWEDEGTTADAEADEAERKRQADLRAWRIELGEVEPDEQ